MTSRQVRLALAQDDLVRRGMADVREQLDIPARFPPDVLAAASQAAEQHFGPGRVDRTGTPFVTIDPEGSMDLDQAVWARATGDGFQVSYAIADVAAFAPNGGPVDREARSRGLTLYAPDGRVSLHPEVLSEGAASLLAGRTRPAVVWDFDLDADALPRSVAVGRALVRSRVQLSYAQVQSDLDADTADDVLRVIRSVGRLRERREAERGGVALPIPEQMVANVGHDWSLTFRAPLPIEGWNAQISLMTGMAAADFMLAHGVGVLRTMPPPSNADLQRVRRTAEALGLEWPSSGTYPDLIRSADASRPAHLAFLSLATTLLRGAGYTVFDGEEPTLRTHSAVAAPYAHVTAPLRRLVDRFGTEIALAACAGTDVPDWVSAALAAVPDQMAVAVRRARSLERESLNLVEAVLLQDRVGESFDAAVVDSDGRGGFSIVIQDPAVRARAKGDLSVGSHAEVSLMAADPATRRVQFEAAG